MSALLAIATRVLPGSSRLAKVPGSSKKNGVPMLRHVAHVGKFERVERRRHGCTRVFWSELENFAEFDGPTAYSAAVQFAAMMAKSGTPAAAMGACVADGPPPPPPPLWRQVEEAQVKLLEGETKEPEPETPAKKSKKTKKADADENQ